MRGQSRRRRLAPGSEPCTSLRKVKDDGSVSGPRLIIPFKPSCGKFRLSC